ncbi:Metalloenzyme, LuxS/M16 peptidase-like protein [Flagelloscypha sp. PMI_526]|nr:Metalloenzyme, LuxS/M16 peptidase-like protein [Flagelloscypha sp. PMI_526]
MVQGGLFRHSLFGRRSCSLLLTFTSSGRFSPLNLGSIATMATNSASEHWHRVNPSSPSIPSFLAFGKPVVKSEQDDREYRIIKLENGIKATIISDPKSDKAAASLNVAVGHLDDPIEYPGLAHFCEHLLFMGTEQFPKENEYSEYLAKHNGHSNAYTGTMNTNYYFTVGTPALEGALTRFAAFFHSPLFSPSCTTRELNAVDSEHKKNHPQDLWRIYQLNKHLSKEGHVWSKFGTGNKESLTKHARDLKAQGKLETIVNPVVTSPDGSLAPSPLPSRIPSPTPSTASDAEADGGAVGRETRRRLVEWWTTEYCAGRMQLCVIGQESLDELSEMVARLFSPIPNRGQKPVTMINDHPFGVNENGTLVAVETLMTFHALELSFPLEWQVPHWRHKPSHFISHLLGHEGPGSLFSYLKNKGWVTALSTGPQSLGRGFAMFKVTIYLTESGFANYRAVIVSTFKYLSMLRASRFESYHQSETSSLSHIRFRFAEKRSADSYATWVAEHSIWPVPEELLISAPQLTWDWDHNDAEPEKKVREYLDGLRLEKGRAVLMAKKDELDKVLSEDVEWLKEPVYGSNYIVQKFSEDFLRDVSAPNDIKELYLPSPNEFIPTNLDVRKQDVEKPAKRPHLIRETSKSVLWHKKDDQFWVPKAYISIELRSPFSNATAKTAVLSRLFGDLVNDSLSEYSYNADLAGLSYQLAATTTGMYISMNGYNDRMFVLVKHILEKLKGLVVLPDRLDVMKEQAKRDWENFFLGQSYTLSDYYARYLTTELQWTQEEKLAELDAVTADEVQAHIKHFLSQVHMRILATGNIGKDEAIRIGEEAEKDLGEPQLPLSKFDEHGLILPKACNFTYSLPIRNPNQANSALTYYVHWGPVPEKRLRVISSLVVQILTEPAFNVLRTQEQLGYVVFCTGMVLAGSTEKGMRIIVQSERKPAYLEDRVEAFLESMKTFLEDLDQKGFEEQKDGLKRKWLESDKNLGDEAGKFMVRISDGQYDFLRNEEDAALLEEISKQEVLDLFMSHVHPSSTTRSKLSIHMVSQKPTLASISWPAALAFEEKVRSSALSDISADAWIEALSLDREDQSAKIPVQEFGKYWVEVLKPKTGGIELLQTIPTLMKEFPSDDADENRVRAGVTYIKDVKEFKKGLRVAPDVGPVVDWDDLPVSKL